MAFVSADHVRKVYYAWKERWERWGRERPKWWTVVTVKHALSALERAAEEGGLEAVEERVMDAVMPETAPVDPSDYGSYRAWAEAVARFLGVAIAPKHVEEGKAEPLAVDVALRIDFDPRTGEWVLYAEAVVDTRRTGAVIWEFRDEDVERVMVEAERIMVRGKRVRVPAKYKVAENLEKMPWVAEGILEPREWDDLLYGWVKIAVPPPLYVTWDRMSELMTERAKKAFQAVTEKLRLTEAGWEGARAHLMKLDMDKLRLMARAAGIAPPEEKEELVERLLLDWLGLRPPWVAPPPPVTEREAEAVFKEEFSKAWYELRRPGLPTTPADRAWVAFWAAYGAQVPTMPREEALKLIRSEARRRAGVPAPKPPPPKPPEVPPPPRPFRFEELEEEMFERFVDDVVSEAIDRANIVLTRRQVKDVEEWLRRFLWPRARELLREAATREELERIWESPAFREIVERAADAVAVRYMPRVRRPRRIGTREFLEAWAKRGVPEAYEELWREFLREYGLKDKDFELIGPFGQISLLRAFRKWLEERGYY